MEYEYIFYSVIGRHAGESIEKILSRKLGEINANPQKISLWAASIDKKSIEQVWRLNSNDEVYVLCKVSETAKDPAGESGEDDKNDKDGKDKLRANIMIGPKGKKSIPEWICARVPDEKYCQEKRKNYQAYVVEEYEIYKSPIIFDFGKYETILRNNQIKSFKERFKSSRFQNTFGRKNKDLTESCAKEIMVIMKLKYPFVVNILI